MDVVRVGISFMYYNDTKAKQRRMLRLLECRREATEGLHSGRRLLSRYQTGQRQKIGWAGMGVVAETGRARHDRGRFGNRREIPRFA
jgi:hypothetical protein